jgi:hypothetical protein
MVGIDTQNVVRDQPEETKHIDLTQSIAFTRDINFPKPHRSAMNRRFDLELSKEIIARLKVRFPNNKKGEIIKKACREQFLEDKKAYLSQDHPIPLGEQVTTTFQARVKSKLSLFFY